MRFCAATSIAIFLGAFGAPVVAAAVVCPIDTESLSFVGSAEEQARCLLRPVKRWAHLGEGLERLPDGLAGLPGRPVEISRQQLRDYLADAGVSEEDLGGSLDDPLSRSHSNGPGSLPALYFVIHDTSTPNYGDGDFPAGINGAEWSGNSLSRWDGLEEPPAHVFVNRLGESLAALGFDTPWRATRMETRVLDTEEVVSRGRFLHVELIQPRRRAPEGGPKNDAIAPEPGFTDPQLERLALLYVAASVRSGSWLIPAFHAVVDNGIVGAHDDPQKFELERWSALLGEVIGRVVEAG